MEIEEILNKLLGDIVPLADQTIDTERFENIENYENVLQFIMQSLYDCYNWKDDNRYSAQRIGKEVYRILKELQEDLDNILGEKSYEL